MAITDDGNGFARFEMSGTFDVSGGTLPRGATLAGSIFRADANSTFSSIQVFRATSPAASSVGESYSLSSGSGLFVNTSVSDLTTQVSFSNYFVDFLNFGTTGTGRIISYEAPLSGTWNEDVVTTLSYSIFNEGTWDFGSYGGTANDGMRLQIGPVSAVPVPASLPLILGGMAVFGLARRRRR